MPDTQPELDLKQALVGHWTPIRHTFGYTLSVGLVAAAMVCMPLIYFAIIAGVGYLIYLHFAADSGWLGDGFHGRSSLFLLIAYLAPGAVGVIVILFMLKPLFAPPVKREPGLVLEPFEEKRLYAFVHMVCDLIGAPKPRVIEVSTDVNASAGLRRGWISLLVPGDLVLSIGTPLVACLSVQQFAGILAHEFGHFAQGSGMRAGFLIHSIMRWFARAAYERDGWDESLEEVVRNGGHWAVSLVALLAVVCVKLTRLILKILLWIARVLGAVMSRQMEFDADRYEARFAGSKAYEANATRLYAIVRAHAVADGEAAEMYKNAQQLPDDFASLVADAANRLDPETLDAVAKRATIDDTRLFDTHPSTAARIKAARALAEPGIFRCDLPATMLFSDFHAASVKASYGHYQVRLRKRLYETTFVPTRGILAARTAQRERESLTERFLGFRPPTWRPLFLAMTELSAPSDPKQAVAWIKAARAKLAATGENLAGHARDYRVATEQQLSVQQAKLVFEMGFRVLPREMGLKYLSPRAADDDHQACTTRAAAAASALDEAFDLAAGRIGRCLRLLCVKGIETRLPDAPAKRARAAELVKVMAALKECDRHVRDLRTEMRRLSALRYAFQSEARIKQGKQRLEKLAESIRAGLKEVARPASAVRYPYAPDLDPTTLADKLLGPSREFTSLDAMLDAASTCIDRYPTEHARVLGELVEIAQSIESILGPTQPATAAPSA